MHLKALVAGSAAALTLAGGAAAATYNVPTHIAVQAKAKAHVTAKIEKAKASNRVVGGGFLGAAVSYLGVDRATIVADLKAGQSLAQIATAQGKTADGLVTALLAPAKLKLDAAVTAGKLTADRETTILTKLQTALTTLVNKTVTPRVTGTGSGTHTGANVHVSPAVILQSAVSYLGLSLKTIVQDVAHGQTLADIAVAQGKTADGLTAAVVAAAKTKLDAQVTAGKITQAQEDSFLATLQTSVQAFVTGSH